MMINTEDDISNLDLNLLRVLAIVLEEGSATRAAARLHVTQSAVSNALARLREMFGDPLMTRKGRGLAPSPLATSLLAQLGPALRRVEDVVRVHRSFDPRTSTRRFTLGCTDAHHFHDVPRLLEAFERRMPRASLHIVSPDTIAARSAEAIDATLIPAFGVAPGVPHAPVYAEGFAWVVRRDHPRVGESVDLDDLRRLRHVDTLIADGRGGVGHEFATRAFARLGLVRDIVSSVPTFSAAALAVARSDAITGLPRTLAEILCTLLPLRIVGTPFPAVTFPMCLTWPEVADADPGARCFRALVLETLRRDDAPPPARRRGTRATRRKP